MKKLIGNLKYWFQLGQNYGHRRQWLHLWRRWRDPEHDRITCICCCWHCDLEEEEETAGGDNP